MVLLASSRHEVGAKSFPVLVYILVPLLALGLQSLLSLHLNRFDLIDLPLLITIYYSITQREPVSATLVGAVIGIAQDGLTHNALGIFGISKAVIGYSAASVGVRVDTENHGARLLLTFGFTLAQTVVLWLLQRHMNALVGVVLFALLDQTRRTEY
jgi:rod shape-determining protein MreD